MRSPIIVRILNEPRTSVSGSYEATRKPHTHPLTGVRGSLWAHTTLSHLIGLSISTILPMFASDDSVKASICFME